MPEYLTPGVYVENTYIGPRPIQRVSTGTAGFVGMAEKGDELNDKPELVTSWVEFVSKFGRYTLAQPYLAPAVYGFFENGGARCYVTKVKNAASDDDHIGVDKGPSNRSGLQAFVSVNEINIVCIPGMASNLVQKGMISHCEAMKNRFCILDPARDADINALRKQKELLVSEKGYAALYYPWIKATIETLKGGEVKLINEYVSPSGYLAGVYARTDRNRGVHKSPANEIVQGAIGVKAAVTQRQQDILNPLGINSIRAFAGRGIRVWEGRTISTDSLWKYVNIRRLFLFLEESIVEGTQWVVFEPDNQKLWASVKQSITQFLTEVWKDGALMGSKVEQAFFVKCDLTTMTKNDIANGRLIILIGVAPVKPTEFIVFRVTHSPGGSTVSE
jgi:phage tail sheath protein FI